MVETTIAVAVEWEPSAFDSFDDTGLKVEMGVRGSGAPEGAVVRWGVASACDTPPVGGGRSSATVALVPGVTPAGGEAVVVSFLGAAANKRKTEEAFTQETELCDVLKLLEMWCHI